MHFAIYTGKILFERRQILMVIVLFPKPENFCELLFHLRISAQKKHTFVLSYLYIEGTQGGKHDELLWRR